MSFVVRTGVIAVDDADGIVELEAVFKTQAAARIDRQHPAILNQSADARGDLDAFACAKLKADRRKEVISRGTACCAFRQTDALIGGDCLLDGLLGERCAPIRNKASDGYFFKSGNANHKRGTLLC